MWNGPKKRNFGVKCLWIQGTIFKRSPTLPPTTRGPSWWGVRGAFGHYLTPKKCENSLWAISNQKNLKKHTHFFRDSHFKSINALCSCNNDLFSRTLYEEESTLWKKSMTCFYKCMEFEQKGKGVWVGNEEMLESAWRSAKNKSYAWTCLPKQTDTMRSKHFEFEKKSWSNQPRRNHSSIFLCYIFLGALASLDFKLWVSKWFIVFG